MQGGSNFSRQSDLFKSVSSKFGPSTRLDEKTLREAAMGYGCAEAEARGAALLFPLRALIPSI